MLKKTRLRDRLIFNMGNPLLIRWDLYIETAPSSLKHCSFNGCNLISMRNNMTPLTAWLWLSQHGGCWWPGTYLVPGHLLPSWWHSPVGLSQECPTQGSFCACAQPMRRRHYIVTSSPIGWAHTQNDPCQHNGCIFPGVYQSLIGWPSASSGSGWLGPRVACNLHARLPQPQNSTE